MTDTLDAGSIYRIRGDRTNAAFVVLNEGAVPLIQLLKGQVLCGLSATSQTKPLITLLGWASNYDPEDRSSLLFSAINQRLENDWLVGLLYEPERPPRPILVAHRPEIEFLRKAPR